MGQFLKKADLIDFFSGEWYNTTMAKQRMIVTDDQLLIDMDLLFNAIREAKGDWEKVEDDMNQYLASIQAMSHLEDSGN